MKDCGGSLSCSESSKNNAYDTKALDRRATGAIIDFV